MPRCEYSCCVTLLPCNQFHWGQFSRGEGRSPWPPLRTATGCWCNRIFIDNTDTVIDFSCAFQALSCRFSLLFAPLRFPFRSQCSGYGTRNTRTRLHQNLPKCPIQGQNGLSVLLRYLSHVQLYIA